MRRPFAGLPPTAASHFRLYFYAAVAQVLSTVSASRPDSSSADVDRGLYAYADELLQAGVPGAPPPEMARWWRDAIAAWEAEAPGFLPIRAVREGAALDHQAMVLVFVAALPDEDARFGALFQALGGNGPRAALWMLSSLWGDDHDRAAMRARVRALADAGLVRELPSEAPRVQRTVDVPGPVWDALRGDCTDRPAPWATYRAPERLQPLDAVMADAPVLRDLARAADILRSGLARTLVVRGPQRNGRRTMAGAVARALGFGVLEIVGTPTRDDELWRQTGALATALRAMPVVVCDPPPGATAEIPRPSSYPGPMAVVIGRAGTVAGSAADDALSLSVPMPSSETRRRHWSCSGSTRPIARLEEIADRFRMTSGNLRRASRLADSYAALEGRTTIAAVDVQKAVRAVGGEALDTLAVRLETAGDWSRIAVREETLRELTALELRCRHRERLAGALGPAAGGPSCGVRALFRGPSGTGKTLAARLLGATLQMDVYRLDLASIVDRYIGETEKRLERALARAEELDIMLLLDEGDALLTQRTAVHTSTDRYANLETNYLLQRLETFEGILVVTTNAGDRIDAAFERRMDVVVDFQPPQAAERWELWQLHLPPGHAVEDEFLGEVAARCVMSGGQIRNAVLHAALLAIQEGGTMGAAHVDAAVRREYRKQGAVCPLRVAPFSMVAG